MTVHLISEVMFYSIFTFCYVELSNDLFFFLIVVFE